MSEVNKCTPSAEPSKTKTKRRAALKQMVRPWFDWRCAYDRQLILRGSETKRILCAARAPLLDGTSASTGFNRSSSEPAMAFPCYAGRLHPLDTVSVLPEGACKSLHCVSIATAHTCLSTYTDYSTDKRAYNCECVFSVRPPSWPL